MNEYPWEFSRNLSEACLRRLASRVLSIRNGVARDYNPGGGDGPWSRGCVAYERTVNLLEKDAEAGQLPGLRVVRRGLYCTLFVNGVPIRFYRGDPNDPPIRHLAAGLSEQFTFDLGDVPDQGQWCWLLAVETDAKGFGSAVTFFQANRQRNTRRAWRVAIADEPSVAPLSRPGVELPPPPVSRKVKVKEDTNSRKDGTTDDAEE